jgi:RND family efflux transporter MFP subunit
MRAFIAVVVSSAGLLSLAGCGSAAGSLPPPQPPKVTVAPAIEREVRDIDEYTGRTESVQTVEVRPRVSGYLQEIYFEEGGYVKVGDPLFLIDPRTYQAEHDQAKAKIKLYEAKHLYAVSVRKRSDKLIATNSVSREEYEQNVAAENEALAALHSAEADAESARLNLEFTRINAEIAGRIDRAYVTKGNLVQSGPAATVLTKIVSVDPIYVFFNPDEQAFLRYTKRRVGEGTMASQHVRERHIETTIILADSSTYPEKGTVDFASNTVDPSTGTIQVRAAFPNEKRALTPGLFVRLQIAAEQAYQAVLVPERAINTDQSDKFVYVVDDKSVAQRRNVELGTKHGRLRVIKRGLAAGEKVIISGGLLVRPGEAVQASEGKIEDKAGESLAETRYKPPVASPSPQTPKADETPAQPRTHPPVER